MRTTRKAVEEWLRLARREAKVHQNDPVRLRAMCSKRELGNPSLGPELSVDEVVAGLHRAVFRTQQGPCIEDEELRHIYSGENGPTVECGTLAHMVSCETCLEKVNTALGIDLLSARDPIDKLGRDKSSG